MIRFLLGLAFAAGLFLHGDGEKEDGVSGEKLPSLARALQKMEPARPCNRWRTENGFENQRGQLPIGRPTPRLAAIRVGTNDA